MRDFIAVKGRLLAVAVPCVAVSGCYNPHVIDGQAATYCEAKGFIRGTDANAECALKREEEQEAAGLAPPAQASATSVSLIGSLPAPPRPSAVSQTIPTSVIQGQTAMVSFSFSPTCDAVGLPTVSLEKPPKHGAARIVQRNDDPRLARIVAPASCGKSKVPGVAVDYTAQRDYFGEDSLEIATVSASGVTTLLKVPLTVEKPPLLDNIDPTPDDDD